MKQKRENRRFFSRRTWEYIYIVYGMYYSNIYISLLERKGAPIGWLGSIRD
jgi:hypothetical protein